ncbi:hypothetical protein BDF14DRAFT_1878324 [Spinellus fusiger]|nr:hypothetical protein BDF14DRAFT_1878324 [Spinellus fusiger]
MRSLVRLLGWIDRHTLFRASRTTSVLLTGGEFDSPVSAQDLGNRVFWKDMVSEWWTPPWRELNGPVYAITPFAQRQKLVSVIGMVLEAGLKVALYPSSYLQNNASVTSYPQVNKDSLRDQRTQVDIVLQTTPNTTITIDQSNTEDKTTLLYSKTVTSTSDLQPTVLPKVAQTVIPPKDTTTSIVADWNIFDRNSTLFLSSVLEYSPANANADITSWHPIGHTTQDIVWLGGDFLGPNLTYAIVGYDTHTSTLLPLHSGGLNSRVSCLLRVEPDTFVSLLVFVYGGFDGTINTTLHALHHIAQLNTQTMTWSAVHEDVDEPVDYLIDSENSTLTLSGFFSHLYNTSPVPSSISVTQYGAVYINTTRL